MNDVRRSGHLRKEHEGILRSEQTWGIAAGEVYLSLFVFSPTESSGATTFHK
jgi:hypothetical protein